MSNATLKTYLAQQTWRHLLAILAAHQLSITTSKDKAALLIALEQHLSNKHTLTLIVAQLDAESKDALRQLVTAGGALPIHTFETRYGSIRPYRPWRKAEAGDNKPWLAPVSTTETLWYLGLIYRDPPKRQPGVVPQYVIPDELLAFVAQELGSAIVEPSNSETVDSRTGEVLVGRPGRNGALVHHLAIWLATVQAGLEGKGVKPVHQHWLPPSVVALLCERLGLDQDEGFIPIRSERHHPYLAFLHYLALAADFVTITPSTFGLTPAAWAWLQADVAARQSQLETAWRNAPVDLAHRFTFRWEPLSPRARAFIGDRLATLSPTQPIPLADLVQQWRLLDSTGLLPGPRPADWRDEATLYEPPAALIQGPLHWLGFIDLTVAGGTLYVSRQSSIVRGLSSPCTMPKQPVNTVLAPINVQPVHLVHLAQFCDWTVMTATPTATPHTFTLAPERIGQLAAGGVQPEQLLSQLADALGRRPNRRVIGRIRGWAQAGQQLRLRPLLVLEADSPARLAQLRRHKLVRNRLGEVIAPTRIALNPADAPALAQTLRTLGYYVEPPAVSLDPAPGERNGDEAGLTPMWQWLLVTLYQGLGAHLPLPMALPWETRHALRRQLTALQQATAEAAAQQLLEHLQMALNGYLQVPLWQEETVTDPEPVIRAALDHGADIEIRYTGPSDGHVSTRTVTPYWIEDRHQIRYLIGWCHLRQQERTFRVDRIETVRVAAPS